MMMMLVMMTACPYSSRQGMGGYARALLVASGLCLAHDSSAATNSHKDAL
jgi:hypothetical protein